MLIAQQHFIVSYDFRNPTCDELNTIMAEVRAFHDWFHSSFYPQMFKPQVDVDHNGKVDLREFIVMMYNQVDAIILPSLISLYLQVIERSWCGQVTYFTVRSGHGHVNGITSLKGFCLTPRQYQGYRCCRESNVISKIR